ncbi:ATP-dependent 6-phosphofructokinase 2 [Thermaurantimonas aggregans]|uniref:ATP-dependent 6-phosphofructokinase n=1 Tax=Thermaurantimonas aggregans TaxID=2173829 RepID=A0A401XI00_9FLAO|nr:6-phosphofructokinase [Thermaurantimonas aggregans]MCX8149191.1 6-phosphofructokinase [Thermaurantimonas aggregans]GCD76633.1 ATP-dependent 6-phosphofructokinase 2 [Thermaurantimonas aggregans]
MKRIGIFTSGGDAPGMNACIRAAVRTALANGLEVYGIYRGYLGMIEGDIVPLQSSDVSNIIQRGGTILKTARSDEFRTPEGRSKAAENLKKFGIEGLVCIGGDGSFKGASVLYEEHGIKTIGAPGTIDNDLYGTDSTIGYDTAVNTVVEAVDKLRDTAASHNRLFIVEVMGRDAGFIALRSGIACGAEAILVPETPTYIDGLIQKLREGWSRKKHSSIVIVAEGDESGGAYQVADAVKKNFDKYDVRVTILGHIQRGGSPSAYDRVLASEMGYAAVKGLISGKYNVMVGRQGREIVYVPFEKAIKHNKELNKYLLEIAETLSR